MASTSIPAFSNFYSQSKSLFISSKSPRCVLPNSLHKHYYKHLPFSFHLPTLRTTLSPTFTCSHAPSTPTPTPISSNSPPTILSKFVSEKLASFLIGSFILFVACFGNRPAVAVSPPSAVSGGVLDEEEKSEEEMCEKILENDPKNVEALKVILYGKIRRGKASEAVKFVDSLIKAEPNEVEWRLLLALCYEIMGHFTKAKRLFREVLQQRPLLVRALHGLAMVMHKNHEGPAVIEMLNKAQELAAREERVTEERNIRILIAQMFVVQGNLEEGLKRFQALVDENPRDFRPYLCQGIIYSLLDKKEEAAQHFETYQALVPEEFPQRGFLDDVALTAKGTTREQLQKEFGQYSNRK